MERSGRELPIEADVVGLRPTLAADQHITLTGPSPLGLVIGSRSNRSSRNGDTG
ncbi:Uracil phosphoribosyltransferase, partial [Candidatus Endoriftia persephone str. Guaymas]|nr:Uracil phosphoribosyltransferase [Candidatus Endoriftia persephone str. Guaymas]